MEKLDVGECELWILTLSLLPILVVHYGYSVLEKIQKGCFDEADIKIQGIPQIWIDKVNLQLLCNDFFGDLIFILNTHDRDYAFRLIEYRILNSLLDDEKEYCEMVLQYVGIRMLSRNRLPWEIEYGLRMVIHQPESFAKNMKKYE